MFIMPIRRFVRICLLATILATPLIVSAEEKAEKAAVAADKKSDDNADKDWNDLRNSLRITPPDEWQTRRPTDEEMKKFMQPFVIKLLDKAHAFYTKYPKDKRSEMAQQMELENTIGDYGFTDVVERLKRFTNGPVLPKLKEHATRLIEKFESVGKPFHLAFKAVDGREVDFDKMKGKVVLIDFWATWCMPCVGEIPHVKEAYDQLHAKGFEVVGISLDTEQAKLTKFTAERQMPWPQYYDGKQWENVYAQKFGITAIPAMWLVDKKGVLRDLNAREDVKTKIEKLLAE